MNFEFGTFLYRKKEITSERGNITPNTTGSHAIDIPKSIQIVITYKPSEKLRVIGEPLTKMFLIAVKLSERK